MNQSNHFSMKKYLLLNRQKYWCCLVNTPSPLRETDTENRILTSSYFSGTLELEQWWLVEWMIWVAGAVGLFICWIEVIWRWERMRCIWGDMSGWLQCSKQGDESSSWSQRSWPVMWPWRLWSRVGFSLCMQPETTGNSPRYVCICMFDPSGCLVRNDL